MQMQGLAENFSSLVPWEFGFRRNCTPNSLKNFRDNTLQDAACAKFAK